MSAVPTITAQMARSSNAELLLAGARANLDATRLAAVKNLINAGRIDWAALIQMANEHGVVPVLYKSLQRACMDSIPPEHRQALQAQALNNTARTLLLMRELLNLLGAFNAAGVRPLPYKGPVLAMQAYGDVSLRKAGDLDILVPEADLVRARAVIDSLGYKLQSDLSTQDEATHMASPHEYDFVYVHPKHKTMIELHWQVAGRFFSFAPDPVQLWERSKWQKISDTQVRLLQPEDLLLILCAHGTKHFWTRLTWICDIAQFVQNQPGLDWRLLMRRADELDARGMTLMGLLLAQQLLGAAGPPAVLSQARPTIRKQVAELANRLFLPTTEKDAMPKGGQMLLTEGGLIQSMLFHCRTRESWRSAMRYFFHRAFTPNVVDRGWLHLPRGFGFVYYLLRPLRLFGKYAPSRVTPTDHRHVN